MLPLLLLCDYSSDVLALQRRSLRYQIMTRRWIEISDIRRVTIDTRETAVLVDSNQFLTQILPQTIFVMTLSARRYRNVRFQPAQRCRLGDVDVTRCALGDVLLLLTTAIMQVFDRDSGWVGNGHIRSRKLVAAVAAHGNRLLRLPVTVEA